MPGGLNVVLNPYNSKLSSMTALEVQKHNVFLCECVCAQGFREREREQTHTQSHTGADLYAREGGCNCPN
jgi:hypothetical protein